MLRFSVIDLQNTYLTLIESKIKIMTTQEAINELCENISSYAKVDFLEINRGGEITLMDKNRDILINCHGGIEMLEWLEKEYRDKNGNLKIIEGNATT